MLFSVTQSCALCIAKIADLWPGTDTEVFEGATVEVQVEKSGSAVIGADDEPVELLVKGPPAVSGKTK